jgi:hypothetical protein
VIDTGRFESAVLCVEAPKVSGGQLEIEGCDTLGGFWEALDSVILSASRETYVLLRRTDDTQASNRLPRYLRWKATDGGSGTLEICFRITCTFK